MSGCEGRCGVELDAALRELSPLDRQRRDPNPQHTPERCRRIRALRDALSEVFPAWQVVVYPAAISTSHVVTIVERRRVDGGLDTYPSVARIEPLPSGRWVDDPREHAAWMRRDIAEPPPD